MVSSGVVALVIAALAQAVYTTPVPSCGCGAVYPPPCGYQYPALEEGCCPGPVVEQKSIVNKPVTVPFTYTEPTFSKQCYQRPAGVDKKVFPSAFETAPVCETQETVVKIPTTDVEVQEQPLCRKTCTTSEYIIQIPIVETTCTSAPLCKKTVRTQGNLLTTVSKKTSCAKQVCTQNKIVEQPYTETVCQNYEGCVTKTGAQTVLKPEVVKSCVQLPPRKCLKPATGPGTYVDYGSGPVAVGYEGGYGAPGYVAEAVYPGGFYGGPYFADAYAPGYYGEAFYPGGAYGGPYLADAYGPGYYGSAPYFTEGYGPAYYGPGYYGPGYVEAAVLPAPYPGTCTCIA